MKLINSPHNLLLQSGPRNQSININDLLLSDPVCPVHRLQVLHWIPIVLHEYNRISPCQIQSQTTHLRRQQQHVDRWIVVEPRDDRMSLSGRNGTVQTQIRDTGHVFLEKIIFDYV